MQHTCFGKAINTVQIPGLLAALLRKLLLRLNAQGDAQSLDLIRTIFGRVKDPALGKPVYMVG